MNMKNLILPRELVIDFFFSLYTRHFTFNN